MADNFKGFDEETVRRVSNVGDAIKEIKVQAQELDRELKSLKGPLTSWEKSFNDINDLSKKILDTQGKSLLSSKGTVEALKSQTKANNTALGLDIKINELLKSKTKNNIALNALIDRQVYNLSEAKDQVKILAEQYENLANSAASLDKRTKFFTLISDVVKDVKGLRMLSSPFGAAAKASREQVLQNAKGGSKKSVFNAGIKAFGEEALSGIANFFKSGGWISSLIKIIQFFKDAMFVADERVTKLAKGLMISKDAAKGVYNSFKDTKHEIDSIYNTTKDVTEAFTDLTELTEFATSATNEMIEAQIILTKNLGLSKEEAFGVQEAFAASNIEADKGKDIVYDQIAAFANQNKLISTGKKIFSDIAKTSKLIQINFNGNLNNLVKTTLEAKKLGLTLDQVSKIGKSLLNFEQSISNELEAELLIGRDLNLERARAYALNHDIAGLTQEISKQGITQEKFAAMNVIQQEAIAGALGMSAEEMGDILYKQKLLEKVGGQYLKNLRERAKATEDINLQNKVAQLEQGILSGKTLEQAEKSTTTQEKFNQSLEQAKEVFSDFVDGEYLEDLADGIKNFVNLITGSSEEERKAKKLARQLEEQTKTDEEKAKIKQLKEQSQGSNTTFGNKIIGNIIPSFKIISDILNINKESKSSKAKEELQTLAKSKNIEISSKDFIIKTLPEDTVVAAGGTSLGNSKEMVQLLTEQNHLLMGILNKEGTIILNGTKMGTAMAVGGYKIQ